ncbi:MAG: hypothetical protein HRU28_17940 [Rhizobiales bacterium]|nr:hypothetical protein [Hyphomicrobiales bacterium]
MRLITKGVLNEYMAGAKQIFNTHKIEKELNWHARPIEESLKDSLEWIRNNDIRNG